MPEGEDRAAALADLAQANMLAGRVAATIDYAERAIAEARAVGSERVQAQALVERWSCSAGEGKDVVPEVLAAVDRAEALGDHVTAARGLNNIVDLVAVEERRAIIERMRANAESAGFAALAAYSYAEHLSELASLSADRAELDRWLTHAWRWRRLGQCRKGTLWLDFYSALLEAEAGETVGTAADADRSPPYRCASPERDGVRRAGRGGFERRRTLGARPSSRPGQVRRRNRSRTSSTTSRTSWKPHYAPVCPTMFCARSSTRPSRPRNGPARRGTWRWRSSSRPLVIARRQPSTSSRVGDEVERWLRGELELQLAELALAEGANADAAKHAMAARGMLARWPGWRRDRADGLVRRLERRAAAVPGNELSGRELEVAVLLADGLTNAQIAERLFIARKTAAVHVSNILAKLGMRSRTEIAAWAIRTGVAASDVERAG